MASDLHRAEQILVSVLASLTGLVTTGANVRRDKHDAWPDDVTNAISIFMGDDIPMDDDNIAFIDSVLTVIIAIHVKNKNVLESQINLIKKEITVAIMTDRTQGLLAINTDEGGWSRPELMDGGGEFTAICAGSFDIKYRRSIEDPSVI